MTLSTTEIVPITESTGFNPAIIEKVIHLMHLLNNLNSHPFLKGKWVLKGGTALNLFIFDLPRLSVDIDLNYIGAIEREQMLEERPRIEQAAHAVFSREGYMIKRVPSDHAGGKWILNYQSYTGQPGNLEVDLNFMFRQPLWEPVIKTSRSLGPFTAFNIPITDFHELAAGKLAALLARTQARDLFDSVRILNHIDLDNTILRTAFVVYGGMNRIDWRTVSADDIQFDPEDLTKKLLPVLHDKSEIKALSAQDFGKKLVAECQKQIASVLPLNSTEMEFLDLLLDKGDIKPELLTNDSVLQKKIRSHPLLHWKALNVRKHKGITVDKQEGL
jgi:predicted nucleotidyltransferase component of viral defense system